MDCRASSVSTMATVSKRRNLRDLFKRDSSSSSCVLSRPEKRLFEGWSNSNKSVNSTLSDKSVLQRPTYHVRFAEPVIVESGATASCYGRLSDEERQAYYYTVGIHSYCLHRLPSRIAEYSRIALHSVLLYRLKI